MTPRPTNGETCVICEKPVNDGSNIGYAKPRRGKPHFFHQACYDALPKMGGVKKNEQQKDRDGI